MDNAAVKKNMQHDSANLFKCDSAFATDLIYMLVGQWNHWTLLNTADCMFNSNQFGNNDKMLRYKKQKVIREDNRNNL